MAPKFLSRRNFLRNTIAAGGAAAVASTLGQVTSAAASNTPAPAGSPYATVKADTYPANKMSAALPEFNQKITLYTPHVVKEIAPGVPYELWTFGNSAPGPHLRVRAGEAVDFTLVNADTEHGHGVMAHSIDFHSALLPWDKYYQSVQPGEKLSFSWASRFPGVFMYHCGTPPVLAHIGNGMHGAIIVEPRNGWPEKASKEYVLVQHEYYLGQPDDKGIYRGDIAKMQAGKPDHVVFNGYVNQYQAEPLTAEPNELIRLYVCNAGPTTFSAFHVIGTVFTTVYPDGNPANKQTGMQTVTIPPGGGYVVEMRIPDEGLYPFVTHSFAYTGLGALGVIKVGNPKMPEMAASH